MQISSKCYTWGEDTFGASINSLHFSCNDQAPFAYTVLKQYFIHMEQPMIKRNNNHVLIILSHTSNFKLLFSCFWNNSGMLINTSFCHWTTKNNKNIVSNKEQASCIIWLTKVYCRLKFCWFGLVNQSLYQ